MLPAGSLLGGYQIVAPLGRGGMGEIYRATDLALGRDIALKILRQQPSISADQKERFVREARAASALNHPNIITIYEIGSDQGIDFIAMELVRGRTLADVLLGRLPKLETLLSYTRQIADGLSRAHSAGIVHRDLKPGNVMITDDGLIKILDFGLAKTGVDVEVGDLQTQAALTQGFSIGTIGYMSPEQALGGQVDARSDVFSFGVMVFELLTKKRPFEGKTSSEILRNLHFVEPALDAIPAAVPRPLVSLIRRCLEKQPQDRYRTMADVAEVLKTVAADSVQAPRPSIVARLANLPGGTLVRRPAFALIALAFVIAVVAVRFAATRQQINQPAPTMAIEALPSSPYDLTTMAAGHLVRQDRPDEVTRAIELLERAVRVDPGYAPAYAHLSEAYLRSYRTSPDAQWLKLARESAERALSLNPDLAIAHVAIGFVQHDAGQTESALASFQRATELDPLNPFPHMGKGATLSAARRDADAETALRRAAELGTEQWRTHTELGQFFYLRARYDEAIKAWERARVLTSDNLVVLRNLGAAYFRARRYDEAASVPQRALEVRPSGPVLANLGNIYFAQGRYSDAVASFEKALELDANNYLYWGNVGDAYRWAPGRRPDAPAAYRRASELLRELITAKPADADLRTRHALYLVKAGDRAAALAELIPVRDSKLTAQMLYRMTVVYELAGDRAAALNALERALGAGYPASELNAEPELTSLRSDPRYHRLLTAKPGASR